MSSRQDFEAVRPDRPTNPQLPQKYPVGTVYCSQCDMTWVAIPGFENCLNCGDEGENLLGTYTLGTSISYMDMSESAPEGPGGYI